MRKLSFQNEGASCKKSGFRLLLSRGMLDEDI